MNIVPSANMISVICFASYVCVLFCVQIELDRRVQFDEFLRDQGFQIRAVPRDGNCFLVAFLLMTIGEEGAREVHRLRHAVVTASADYPERDDPGFVFLSRSGVMETYEEQIKNLTPKNAWFDHLGITVCMHEVSFCYTYFSVF
jgi:hypothetical protein